MSSAALRPAPAPPHDLEAEEAVLGACLANGKRATIYLAPLSIEDFYLDKHRHIATAIHALAERGDPIDLVSVADQLRTTKHLETIGGPSYLAMLLTSCDTPANATHHASIVAQLSTRRLLQEALHRAQTQIDTEDLDTAVARLRGQLEIIDRLAPEQPQAHPTRTALNLLQDPPPPQPHILAPGLIVPSGITVLAGATKVGKTLFELYLANALTTGIDLFGLEVDHPTTVLMIQLELGQRTLHDRLQAICKDLPWPNDALERLSILCRRAFKLDGTRATRELTAIIQDAGSPEVTIIDSVNAAIAGDPNDTQQARALLDVIRSVQEATGTAFLLTSELRKQPAGMRRQPGLDDLKGSNELAYDADAILSLRHPKQDDRRRLELSFPAMRHAEPPHPLNLERRGLTLLLDQSDTGSDRAVEGILRNLMEHSPTFGVREARHAVKDAGIKVRESEVDRIRRELLA